MMFCFMIKVNEIGKNYMHKTWGSMLFYFILQQHLNISLVSSKSQSTENDCTGWKGQYIFHITNGCCWLLKSYKLFWINIVKSITRRSSVIAPKSTTIISEWSDGSSTLIRSNLYSIIWFDLDESSGIQLHPTTCGLVNLSNTGRYSFVNRIEVP